MSTKQERIAMLARNNPSKVFTSLNHYIDYDWMLRAYELTRKDGAVGIDGQTSQEYALRLEDNLKSLLHRMKSGTYKAPSIRRAYIPKPDGSKRPLGISTFEDKVAQRAIVMLLEPIYEQTFKGFSYGFRPRKSAHQALRHLRNNIMDNGGRWIMDVDITQYFDTINKTQLREFLNRRVTDGVVRKLIDKWLKAGIVEGDKTHYQLTGTPQGGVASPLLANIYLHYVLDEWYADVVEPRMEGRSSVTRFCDDFVMVFENYNDCMRVFKVLGERLKKFGLTLHPDKTRIVDFRFKRPGHDKTQRPTAFKFLGFTHLWKKSKRGKFVVLQRTAKERLAKAISGINDYCRASRHKRLQEQHQKLSSKVRGHYAYFGITGNHNSLRSFVHQVERIWRKWLSRRSRKSKIPWNKFRDVLERFPLPKPQIYHQYHIGERSL
jgi:group II intron reverse transcriptase/maturase